MRVGRAVTVLVITGALSAAACGAPDPSAAPTAMPPVVLPDVSQLAAPVQRQLRDHFAALTRTLAKPGATATERADAYGELGRLLLATKLGRAAEASFLNARALAPGDHRWPYYLGHVFLLLRDRPRAIAAFEQARQLAPSDLATLVWLAEAQLDEGRPAEAEPLFVQAASSQPRSAAARFGAGRAALARQSYAAAAQHFEAALALEPQASAVRYPLAMAYRALGDQQKAEAHLRQRGEVWPALPDPLMGELGNLIESVTAHERRGVEALAARDWAAAAAAFRRGLELEPADPALRHRLAQALYEAGDVAGAIRELEDVVRQSPGFVKAQVSLGNVLSARGRHDEAIERFSTALRTDENLVDARVGLAELLRMTGKPEAALVHYRRAVQLDPSIAGAWMGGAAALIALRRHEEARDWLARARRVHPDEPKLAELAALVPPG
jgi:tetratricopeptide (TPR) repeat protein